jgi:DNA-binding MarR family transcriptional regulator
MENYANSKTEQSLPEKYYRTWVLLARIRDAIKRLRDIELAPYRISTRQASLLHLLHSQPKPLTPAEISRYLFRKPHTISVMVNRMGKNGLIRKTKDLKRKNLVRVVLTRKGNQVYQWTTNRDAIYKSFSSLTEEQCDNLRSYLEILKKNTESELSLKGVLFEPPENELR